MCKMQNAMHEKQKEKGKLYCIECTGARSSSR